MDILTAIRNIFTERGIYIGEEIKEDTALQELGVDSLQLVDILISIEEEFGIELDETDLDPSNLNEIGDLVRVINSKIN